MIVSVLSNLKVGDLPVGEFTARPGAVVDAVRRISGTDFEVGLTEHRLGDPDKLIAGVEKIKTDLNWSASYNDLDTIVSHALNWEKKLQTGSLLGVVGH